MTWPIVSRRRYAADLAAAKAQTDRHRERAEKAEETARIETAARRTITRQHAELDAANRRLEGRLVELGRRLSKLAEADPEYAASLERRVERLQRVGKRVLAAYALELHRADKRQESDDEADRKAIADWEQRVKDHDAWKPEPDAERLPEGGTLRPTHPALVLRRALDRCRDLEDRLARAEGRRGVVSGR